MDQLQLVLDGLRDIKATLAVLVADGVRKDVAVKILRPGIKERFRADIEAQYAGAALAERFAKGLRRLRPTDIVKTLDRSARLELR